MELTADKAGQNTSPSAATNNTDKKDKLSPDDSGKGDTKSDKLK